MPEIEIEKLVEKIGERTDGGVSKEFLASFTKFAESVIELDNWVGEMIDRQGHFHRETDKSETRKHLKKNIDSILGIRDGSIKIEPITLDRDDPYGWEIDGYHRLSIYRALGKDKIPYVEE